MQSKAGSAAFNPYNLEDKLFADTRLVISGAVLVYYVVVIRILHIGPIFPNVGWVMTLFLGWSGLLYWSIRNDSHLRTEESKHRKRWLIAVSLPVDWGFIYYCTIHSGGLQSPFYVAVFVLIVFHAYYFPYLNRLRTWRFRWLISGAMAGAIAFLSFYLLLYLLVEQNEEKSIFRLFISVFFAAIVAYTAGFLRYRDRETTRMLRRNLELAELFRGIIRRVNDLHETGAAEIKEHFFDDLAKTIGENLAATCCEVFSLAKTKEFSRKGLWIRETHFTEKFGDLLDACDTVRFQTDYHLGDEASWRVGRYEKDDQKFAAAKNPLGLQMRDFLESPEVRHSLFTIIIRKERSGERTPIGIIRVTNRLDRDGTLHFRGFTDDDEDIIEDVARELSVAIENYRLQSLLNIALEKERRLAQLALKDDLDEIMQEILQSMAEMVEASFAELWIPFEEGFEHQKKFVLRSCYPLNGHLAENFSDAKRSISIEESYIGSLLQGRLNRERIIYEEDIRTAPKYAWPENLGKLGSHKSIAILLARMEEPLGVVCLHPGKNFEWDENIRSQLAEFANLATARIEGARFQRRFHQLSTLQMGLDKLFESKEEVFFHNVAEMVKDIMPAEACSIYTVDREKNVLMLSGSSDSSRETQAKIGSIIFGFDDSVTGRVAKAGEPIMLYGDFHRPGMTEKIFEKTQNHPSAMIACPIFDTQNNVIAVIRCVNKIREKNIVTNTFSSSDGKLFDLIAGIIAALIENRRNIASLMRINQQRQNFLSSVAHEFTSPLQSMRSTVEYLKKSHHHPEYLKDPISQFDFLIEEVDFLNYLITNIRSQGLGERADFLPSSPGPRTNEKLFKIVEKVQTLLKGLAREKGLEIKLVGAFPILRVDKFHLEQVIFNLLVNAIKYTRPNSTNPIEVICEESMTHVILIFRNWGIGVRSNEATRIFDMFERGSNAYISSVTGTGIGLHISKKIMQNLGGDLKLAKLENPTEFTIFLPKD